jgi:hypothetical protein
MSTIEARMTPELRDEREGVGGVVSRASIPSCIPKSPTRLLDRNLARWRMISLTTTLRSLAWRVDRRSRAC